MVHIECKGTDHKSDFDAFKSIVRYTIKSDFHLTRLIFLIIIFRERYTEGQKQLRAGEKWIRNTLSPLLGLDCNYSGFVCFPNIQNKRVLEEAGLTETELKVKIMNYFYHYIMLTSYILSKNILKSFCNRRSRSMSSPGPVRVSQRISENL